MAFYGMSMGGSILVSQLAFNAGRQLFNLLPESVTKSIFGNESKEDEILEFITHNIGNGGLYNAIDVSAIGASGDKKEYLPSGDRNLFYIDGYNNRTGVGYHTAYLKIASDEVKSGYYNTKYDGSEEVTALSNVMMIPCVNGCPKIKMTSKANLMPIASNQKGLTTNIVVLPTTIFFEFEIAYLRVCGANNLAAETKEVENLTTKLSKIKEGINSATSTIGLTFFDEEDEDANKVRDRTIPTYEQVYAMIKRFNTNKPCWLYLGFTERILVVPQIDVEAGKGDTDCVYVKMMLTEIAMAGNYGMGTSTQDNSNVTTSTTVNEANSQGETKSGDTLTVIAG